MCSCFDQIIHKTVHTKTVCGSGEPSSGEPYIKLTVKAKRLERLICILPKECRSMSVMYPLSTEMFFHNLLKWKYSNFFHRFPVSAVVIFVSLSIQLSRVSFVFSTCLFHPTPKKTTNQKILVKFNEENHMI